MRIKKQTQTERRLRTRTLIQLGGLVYKSGLLEILKIELGEDLQDYEHLPKAATVLGFLKEALDEHDPMDNARHHWQRRGERDLKYG